MQALAPQSLTRSRGFSIIEAVMVLLIIATVVGALTPGVIRQITHARTNQAARIVAADIYLAQTTASRSRKPVLMVVDSNSKLVVLSDASTGTQILMRRYDTSTEFKLTRLAGIPARVLVFPSGMVSVPVSIAVGDPSLQRYVNLSRAGQVRIQ